MAMNEIMRPGLRLPDLVDDFFKPLNEFFDNSRFWGRAATMPAVNIIDNQNEYKMSLVAPGLKSEDFKIDVANNMLTISAEKEEKKEEKDERYARREYNYTSFSRSFTLPEDVKQDAIEAKYEDGVLRLMLPKKEEVKKAAVTKSITVQ
jgi:HSP20 family protein